MEITILEWDDVFTVSQCATQQAPIIDASSKAGPQSLNQPLEIKIAQLEHRLIYEIENRIAAENARLYEIDLGAAAQQMAMNEREARLAAEKRERELATAVKLLQGKLAFHQADPKFVPGVYYRAGAYKH